MLYDYELKEPSPCLTWVIPVCVEMAVDPEENWIAVRASGHTEQTPLMSNKKEWAVFADDVKNDVFDI